MGLLSAAVGAIIAAILEVSVLSQLQLGGVTPELVLAMGVGVAMVAGFEAGMIWAFLGGVMLDMLLPERALGATTLVLLVAIGVCSAGRPRDRAAAASSSSRPPHSALSWLYQVLLIALLALTAGIGIPSPQPTSLTISADRGRRHRRGDRVGRQVPDLALRFVGADRLVSRRGTSLMSDPGRREAAAGPSSVAPVPGVRHRTSSSWSPP